MRRIKMIIWVSFLLLPICTSANSTRVPLDGNPLQPFYDLLPDYLYQSNLLQNESFDLFLSGRIGTGVSSFKWNDGPVYAKPTFLISAVGELYANETNNILSKSYYAECILGYTKKGANNLPLDYITLGLMPIGYYFDYSKFRITSKLGVYAGFPISTLRYTLESNVDLGLVCGASVDYRLLSLGVNFERGLVKVANTPLELYNWCLMLHLTCKILSFN